MRNKTVEIFEAQGVKIELGAQYSAKGQIAQLINGANDLTKVAIAHFADRLIEEHEEKFPGGMCQIQNFALCVLEEVNEHLSKGE